MPLSTVLPRLALASFAFAMLATTSASADITVTSARIAAGKLLITGTAAAANAKIRLDGKPGAEFNVTSKVNKSFSFSLVYLPDDCIVSLEQVSAAGSAGPSTDLVVANCGRAGVSPRGPWTQASAYLTNDLVTFQGSTWRAKRDNVSKQPAAGSDWEQFAAKGEKGDAGGAGAGSNGGGGTSVDATEAIPSGPAGGHLQGTYPNPTIRDNVVSSGKLTVAAVTTAKIAAQAVTTTKIADQAVTRAKIANFAINRFKISANSITETKIVDGAVTTPKILDAAVGLTKLAPNSVDSTKVVDDSLGAADLAQDSVGFAEIATDAVQATEIADNSIDSGEIIDNSLFSNDLGSSSVRGSELGTIIRRSVVSAAIAPGTTGSALANCLAGERVITGGNDGSFSSVVVASRDEGNGWRVFIRNNGGSNTTVTTHAYCLQAS